MLTLALLLEEANVFLEETARVMAVLPLVLAFVLGLAVHRVVVVLVVVLVAVDKCWC